MVAAIDYTASNGNPLSGDSLHFLGANNQYEAAIDMVGQVIEPYDFDRSFPVYGFGGIPRHMGINGVSHCFPINGDVQNPSIVSIEGIRQMYRQQQKTIGLGGPTLFAPLLRDFKAYVESQMATCQYQILLLLTDGEIHDMPETKQLIAAMSNLPCSIIIVGVGDERFLGMQALDGDDDSPPEMRRYRDLVQFVPFNECVARGNLAEEVLKEVPGQFCNYMERAGIVPVAVE